MTSTSSCLIGTDGRKDAEKGQCRHTSPHAVCLLVIADPKYSPLVQVPYIAVAAPLVYGPPSMPQSECCSLSLPTWKCNVKYKGRVHRNLVPKCSDLKSSKRLSAWAN